MSFRHQNKISRVKYDRLTVWSWSKGCPRCDVESAPLPVDIISLNDRSNLEDILRPKKNGKISIIDGEIKYWNLTQCYYGESQNQGCALIWTVL